MFRELLFTIGDGFIDSRFLGGLQKNTTAYLAWMRVVVLIVGSSNSSVGVGGGGPTVVSITWLPGLWTQLGKRQS